MAKSDTAHDRRAFLARVAAGTAASVTAAGAATVAQAAPAKPEEPVSEAPQAKGYRLTPHIQRYYDLARS